MHNRPSYQPEHYMSLLGGLCRANWFALATVAGLFALAGFPSSEGPLGQIIVAVALAFITANLALTLALKYPAWYQKVPRKAINRLRNLTLLVLLWDAVHVLGVFDVLGGMQGPMLALLPLMILLGFCLLPYSTAWKSAVLFVAAIIVMLALQQASILLPLHALLGPVGADALAKPVVSYGVLAATLLGAMIVGASLWRQTTMTVVGIPASDVQDQRFAGFTKHFLLKRLQDELQRCKTHAAPMSMICLSPNTDEDDSAIEQLFDDLESDLQTLSKAIEQNTRQDLDSFAYVGKMRFALLLPTADATKAAEVVERIQTRLMHEDRGLSLSSQSVTLTPEQADPARYNAILRELDICTETA